MLGTVETQKHNRSLNPYSQNMSLMHQISLLNQELPPARNLIAASAFSVAFTEIFSVFWYPDQNSVFSLDRSTGFCPLWEMLSPNSFSEHQRGSWGLRITARASGSAPVLVPRDCCRTCEWWGEDWCSGRAQFRLQPLAPESPLKGRFRCSSSCWDGWRVNSTWRAINSSWWSRTCCTVPAVMLRASFPHLRKILPHLGHLLPTILLQNQGVNVRQGNACGAGHPLDPSACSCPVCKIPSVWQDKGRISWIKAGYF